MAQNPAIHCFGQILTAWHGMKAAKRTSNHFDRKGSNMLQHLAPNMRQTWPHRGKAMTIGIFVYQMSVSSGSIHPDISWYFPLKFSKEISNQAESVVFPSLWPVALVLCHRIKWQVSEFIPVSPKYFPWFSPQACCTRSSQSKAATQPKRQGSWVPRDVLLRCLTWMGNDSGYLMIYEELWIIGASWFYSY